MEMTPWDSSDGLPPAPVAPGVIEARLRGRGAAAPASYVRFAIDNGGKRFAPPDKYVRGPDGNPIGLSTVYHHADNQPVYAIEDVWAETGEELGDALVPIMTTDFAGLVCLDYRQGPADPGVVVYDFEAVAAKQVMPLAKDFEAFLAGIGPR